jgi:hypothetical protein
MSEEQRRRRPAGVNVCCVWLEMALEQCKCALFEIELMLEQCKCAVLEIEMMLKKEVFFFSDL